MTKITLREWIAKDPFSLTLSSGFFGFFAHCGLLSVLEEEGFSPKCVSGSSAGALVGGFYSAGLSAASLGEELIKLTREDFWDPRLGFGLLGGRKFRQKLDMLLPVEEFSQCRNKLFVSVYDILKRKTRVLYSGLLAPVIQASCSVPGLFHPVWIKKRPYWDGGIIDRHGLLGMPSQERVLYHHLSSRSPWRRKNSPALTIPARSNMLTLVIEGLPRVGPFRLEQGKKAFFHAQDAARLALNTPVEGNILRIFTP